MYYKCFRVNFRQDGSYINCPDWIKKKKEKINQKNKDYKCFQYAVTVALDYEEIKWNSERVPNIKSFTNKCKQRIGINYKKKKMIGKHLRKIIQELLLIFCILKNKKHVQLISQKLVQIAKNK